MSNDLRADAQELYQQLVVWRRQLHAHPELSGREELTARFVAEQLRALGYQPRERIGDTFGLIADLDFAGGEPIALRADMDALPIHEETGVEYASASDGVMHACGHDAHMAMLLGAARLLAGRRDELKRPIRLIFQGSEELQPGGAAPLIAAGVLEGVSRVFGLHIWSELPIGTLGTRVGPFMSGVSDMSVRIDGAAGHAAMPQQCVDPIVVAAEIITALQTVVSRSIAMSDSAVVTVTQVNAGTAVNVIPPTVELRGTIRALDRDVRDTVERRVRELVGGIARAHGASAEIDVTRGYPPLVNDREAVEQALRAARAIGLAEGRLLTLPVQGGGEDFACYAERVPSAFLFLGGGNEAQGRTFPHHHPQFNVDEDALPVGTALLAQLALA